MCLWKRHDEITGERKQKNRDLFEEQSESFQRRRLKRYDYIWDLDDGFPGFIRQSKRDRLKLFLDSDKDGLFTQADELIGTTRVRRAHRRQGRRNLLDPQQQGMIQAFNSDAVQTTTMGHAQLLPGVGLKLIHADDSIVAVFRGLLL